MKRRSKHVLLKHFVNWIAIWCKTKGCGGVGGGGGGGGGEKIKHDCFPPTTNSEQLRQNIQLRF